MIYDIQFLHEFRIVLFFLFYIQNFSLTFNSWYLFWNLIIRSWSNQPEIFVSEVSKKNYHCTVCQHLWRSATEWWSVIWNANHLWSLCCFTEFHRSLSLSHFPSLFFFLWRCVCIYETGWVYLNYNINRLTSLVDG